MDTQKERKKQERKKEDLIKNFFPSCVNSPGGTEYLNGRKETNSSRKRAVRKMELNLTSENSDNENDLFIQKKVKPLDLNLVEEPVVKVLVTTQRNDIADKEKGGKGVSKNFPSPGDRLELQSRFVSAVSRLFYCVLTILSTTKYISRQITLVSCCDLSSLQTP